MRLAQRIVRGVGGALLSQEQRQRLAELPYVDAGHGYDVFGMHPDWLGFALALVGPLYRRYFRVSSHGAENVPTEGPAILIANHAGTLPIDAAMICCDVFERARRPRMPRPVSDLFVAELPFVSATFARVGVVPGARVNVRSLLERGELCLIFPEGMLAMSKPRDARYRLGGWRVGHAELALRHGAKIVPVAVIGSEEQWPTVARVRALRPFGAPYLPVMATPFPLPVHYHIHYGEPIDLRARFGSSELSSALIDEAASVTREALQALIDRGVQERSGVFR